MDGKFDYDNNPSWRIFRIMAEFIDGFDFLAELDKTVSFFGSARLTKDSPYYQQAMDLARALGQEGYTIITGGGPGIMEAANHGAKDAGVESVGLNIELPMGQRTNPHLTQGMGFHYFFTRKVMMMFSAEAYVFFPGGLGTLDEFFEMVTLIQTKKVEEQIPIVLVGTAFWQPLMDWIRDTVYGEFRAIDARDQHIWKLTDSVDEAVSHIQGIKPKKRVIKRR